MSIITSIAHIASEYRQARARYRMERTLFALSPEMQKDIGWPDAYVSRGGPCFPAGNAR